MLCRPGVASDLRWSRLLGPMATADGVDAALRRLAQRLRGRPGLLRLEAARVGIVPRGRRRLAIDVVVRLRDEGLHDVAAVGRLDGVGLKDVTGLGKVDRDAHSLLAATDLAVLVVEQLGVVRLGLAAVVALVGRQIVQARAVVTDPPFGPSHGYRIPVPSRRSTHRTAGPGAPNRLRATRQRAGVGQA